MSSPHEPPTEPRDPAAPTGDAANPPGDQPEPAAGQDTGQPDRPGKPGHTDTDQPGQPDTDQPAGEQPGTAQPGTDPGSDPGAGQPGSDSNSGDSDLPRLPPIPPGGTTAPPDRDRVFGHVTSTFANAPTPAGQRGGWQRGLSTTTPATSATSAPPTPQPTEEDLRKIRSRGRFALVLGIMSMLGFLLFPSGLFLGVAAIVIGILARRMGSRASTVSPGAVPGIVLGIVSTLISAVIGVTAAVFWTEVSTYLNCQEGANTRTAKDKCYSDFREDMEKRLPTEPR